MNINIDKLIKLNGLLSLVSRRRHKIVLNPGETYQNEDKINDKSEDIVFDKKEWEIPEELYRFVEEVSKNNNLSNEDKILSIFAKVCENYVYDDNILSYIKKSDEQDYTLPDWYGRDTTPDWEENRKTHNRRVCYEVSRYVAKSINELFKDNEDFNCCILWDKGQTHYYVGLTCNEYSITLDVDDFENIKDLTRLKMGLTIEGIVILEDTEGKFKSALDEFNNGRNKYAIKKIKKEIEGKNSDTVTENNGMNLIENDDVAFLKNAVEILTQQHDIDSPGLFEYMKEIVDIKIGPESRKKVWKKLRGKSNEETRYMRCLIIDVDNQKLLIDVDERIIRPFDEEEFYKEDADFIPYKKLYRAWDEYYDGR